MPYDEFGRAYDRAERDRRRSWFTCIVTIIAAAVLALALALCSGDAVDEPACRCPCGCCEVSDGS